MTARSGASNRFGVPPGLTDELVDVLAVLDDAPHGLAEATIALLPYGSRTSLVAHDVIERMDGSSGEAVAICITDRGWSVIAACARARHQAPRAAASGRPQLMPRVREFVQALQHHNPTVDLNGLSARLHREH